jgi:hypothetical protein
MAGLAALVLAIELLEAARAAEARPEREGAPLCDVLSRLREAAPDDAAVSVGAAGDIAAIADRVGSGALAAAAGVELPGVAPRPRERQRSR